MDKVGASQERSWSAELWREHGPGKAGPGGSVSIHAALGLATLLSHRLEGSVEVQLALRKRNKQNQTRASKDIANNGISMYSFHILASRSPPVRPLTTHLASWRRTADLSVTPEDVRLPASCYTAPTLTVNTEQGHRRYLKNSHEIKEKD